MDTRFPTHTAALVHFRSANFAVGFTKKASNTRSVCRDIRTSVSFLP